MTKYIYALFSAEVGTLMTGDPTYRTWWKGPVSPWMAADIAANPRKYAPDGKRGTKVRLVIAEMLDTGKLAQKYLEGIREMHFELDGIDMEEYKEWREEGDG
jgi:hypothetical protein